MRKTDTGRGAGAGRLRRGCSGCDGGGGGGGGGKGCDGWEGCDDVGFVR